MHFCAFISTAPCWTADWLFPPLPLLFTFSISPTVAILKKAVIYRSNVSVMTFLMEEISRRLPSGYCAIKPFNWWHKGWSSPPKKREREGEREKERTWAERLGLNEKVISDISDISWACTCLLACRSPRDKLLSSNVMQQYNVNHCSGTLISENYLLPPPTWMRESVGVLFLSLWLNFSDEINSFVENQSAAHLYKTSKLL